jgi:RIO-like serine/threonine protein kinase
MINFEDRQKTKILRALVEADKKGEVLTSEEISKKTGISFGSVRGRTSELRKKNMVEATTDARGAYGYFKITEDGLKYLGANVIEV